MALMRLKVVVEYEIPDLDMQVQYGTTDPVEAAKIDAEAFEQDPGFIAEFINEHNDSTEIRVVVLP